jgi:hypothetical protein
VPRGSARGFDRGDQPAVGHNIVRTVQDALAVEDANVSEDLPHRRPPFLWLIYVITPLIGAGS